MNTFKQKEILAVASSLSTEMGCSLIDAVSALQETAAKVGDDEILNDLCEFKAELIGL